MIACDFDANAIKTATAKNDADNIEFVLADIRTSIPGSEDEFENIIWVAAIEHFTEQEIEEIISNIRLRLKKNGVLSGYTIVEMDDGLKHLHQHEYEFKNKEDLYRFFAPHFKHVVVFETFFPSRHNLYFWASDEVLPFQEGWLHWLHK